MGGHSSKQTVEVSTDIVTNSALNVTQDCMSYMSGDQVIDISGDNVVFTGNVQRATLSIDSNCVSETSQKGDFEDKLKQGVAQSLDQQQIAGTQWLDPSRDDLRTNITQKVATSVTYDNLQNCVKNLSGRQLITVSGNNAVVADNLQEQTLKLASSCLMSGGQAVEAAHDLTNSVNQHTVTENTNAFAFITDAITSVSTGWQVLIFAVIFLIVAAIVLPFSSIRGFIGGFFSGGDNDTEKGDGDSSSGGSVKGSDDSDE